MSTDAEGRVDYMNPAAERLIGHEATAAKGQPLTALFEIVDEEGARQDEDKIAALLAGHDLGASTHPHLLRRHDSLTVAVSIIGAPLHKNGRVDGAVLVLRDMTDENKYIANLSWQASHDALTDLANRREFERRLDLALQPNETASAELRALMFIDLDQFKIINDTCGHEAGDKLLREVSSALQTHLREGDLLARLGGDEFAVLLEDGNINYAAILAERLRHSVEHLGFTWNGRSFTVTASIGLAQVAQGHATRDEALRTADLACYTAKENGRNRVQIHGPEDTELLQRFSEMAWVQRIHDALDEERFCLFAQQIAPLHPDAVKGSHFELLLRLRDRDGALVPPGDFLPAAERYGLMPLIDRWVVGHAFKTLARRKDPSVAICAINLSGATFKDECFVDYVREQFKTYGIQPSTICFEITETSAISNIESANSLIRALQELGCHFALDDFGSGMCSFGYLKNLSVDYLKIDGSFVKDLLTDPTDRAMVEMICRIAQMTGKTTVAEFAENEEIINALREIGVDYAQGYGVAMPIPFESSADTDTSEEPLRVVA